MLYFFTRYSYIVQMFLKYFNIDITTFSDYERTIVILLANILGFIIFAVFLSILYKFMCRFVGGYK